MKPKIMEAIKRLKETQESLEATDFISENDFEEYLQEIYEYEHINYHMRKMDPIMFREEYLNHCDGLEKDGYLEDTDDWKELQHQIDELKDLLADIEETNDPTYDYSLRKEMLEECQERYDSICEEF